MSMSSKVSVLHNFNTVIFLFVQEKIIRIYRTFFIDFQELELICVYDWLLGSWTDLGNNIVNICCKSYSPWNFDLFHVERLVISNSIAQLVTKGGGGSYGV